MDIAFIGDTAYVLVTVVGPELGGNDGDVVGIYRVDGPNSFSIVADLGEFSLANPSNTPFFIPTGVQYALEPFRGGFLVTDAHHNRVLWVTLDGEITELMVFGNIVPTGLAVRGNTIFMAVAGPLLHLPEDGMVVAFGPNSLIATEVASGAGLLVDVEFGRGRTLFAHSQGVHSGRSTACRDRLMAAHVKPFSSPDGCRFANRQGNFYISSRPSSSSWKSPGKSGAFCARACRSSASTPRRKNWRAT